MLQLDIVFFELIFATYLHVIKILKSINLIFNIFILIILTLKYRIILI